MSGEEWMTMTVMQRYSCDIVLLCLTTNVGHVLALTTLMMSSSGEYYRRKCKISLGLLGRKYRVLL